MKLISGGDMLAQLKDDLIGKDSYRGVTLSYSWLANQFSHISLGFIPTILLYNIILTNFTITMTALKSAVIISICWLLFETYNFLGPLLLSKHPKSKLLSIAKKEYVFQPAWRNIAFDTLTDLSFLWLGAFAASLLCAYSVQALIIVLVLFVLLIYPSYYWYLTKIYLQMPQYPFELRLGQWNISKLEKQDVDTVYRFLNNEDQGMHLFVFGTKRSGKTSISVGIATEFSIKHKACVYTTGIKLYSMFFEPDKKLLMLEENKWTWRTASVLVIDDINPGDPIKNDLVSPQLFQSFLDTFTTNNVNRETFRNNNIIWVLGDEEFNFELWEKWQNMLIGIGVAKSKILSINLPSN